MADEFDRIARLRQRFERSVGAELVVGIGDDAAVLSAGAGNLVLSVDAAIEGVHFERRFAPLPVLGARAFSAAMSDLAAMGAVARVALTSLVLPAPLSEADFDALIDGLATAAASYACPIVGGNLSAGAELSITTTVLGRVHGTGLVRSGARAGDRVCVTGTLGGAALGLTLLQRAAAERGPAFAARWQNPRARLLEGQRLLGLASAAIDVSDGALQDLGHICEASRLGAEIEAHCLPFEPGFTALAQELGQDALALALFGGEDYELLYTVPPEGNLGPGTCIGRMTENAGQVLVVDQQGLPLPLSGHGYRHFAG
jgi:thiamine-monophosphate kinase